MSRKQKQVPSNDVPTTTIQERVLVARISPEVYANIEARTKPLDPGSQPNALAVAFAMGQQSVLKILREDIVV